MIGTFTNDDLLKYTETVLQEARYLNPEDHSNYSWLKSKHLRPNECVETYLVELRPLIQKMTPESSAAIAVKLDILAETSTSTDELLTVLKKLLTERDNMQVMAGNVKRAKETKRKVKVLPELGKKKPSVSFVIEYNK